jgi:hypothetical protein
MSVKTGLFLYYYTRKRGEKNAVSSCGNGLTRQMSPFLFPILHYRPPKNSEKKYRKITTPGQQKDRADTLEAF